MQTAFSSRQGQNLLHWNFYFKEQTNKNIKLAVWVYKVKLTVCSAVEISWNIICPCLPPLPQSGLFFHISETIHIPNIPKPYSQIILQVLNWTRTAVDLTKTYQVHPCFEPNTCRDHNINHCMYLTYFTEGVKPFTYTNIVNKHLSEDIKT